MYKRQIKKKGKDPEASEDLKKMMEKFATGTIWHMTKISLVPEKTLYISTPVKMVIDLAATVCTPVLQSTRVMPKCPTLAEDLETILKCPQNQRVDVTAFVVALENERGATTRHDGRDKNIVDVVIRDGSSGTGATECKLTLFF